MKAIILNFQNDNDIVATIKENRRRRHLEYMKEHTRSIRRIQSRMASMTPAELDVRISYKDYQNIEKTQYFQTVNRTANYLLSQIRYLRMLVQFHRGEYLKNL